jgi:acetyl esterase/lipase
MLDDRSGLRPPSGNCVHNWTPTSNRWAWAAYLGHPAGQEEQRPWAIPGRRDDLTGLPPAWIGVGDLGLFHNEGRAYAERLRTAGVCCDLQVIPGMYHAADLWRPRRPLPATSRRRWQPRSPPPSQTSRRHGHPDSATTNLDAGVDLRDVQVAARHADPRTTMRSTRAGALNLDRHPNYILWPPG